MKYLKQVQQLIQESGRKTWRFGDVKYWSIFKNSNLLTLSWLDAKIDYQNSDLGELKRGRRVVPRWVEDLTRNDLLFIIDKEHYFGLAIALMEYHRFNPTIELEKDEIKPAIRIQWIHRLDQPASHQFDIKTLQPDTFGELDHWGFSLPDTLTFLKKKYPQVIDNLLEILNSDIKKSVDLQSDSSFSWLAEIRAKYPNPNMILYGPPGTGKTFQSIQMALDIVGETLTDIEDNNLLLKKYIHQQIEFLTFHQNYTYEDFIQGLRPVTGKSKNKTLQFEYRDGLFKRLADRATLNYLANKEQLNTQDLWIKKAIENTKQKAEKSESDFYIVHEPTGLYKKQKPKLQNYVLIIDEINRANISSVFGELISLIEKDKRYDARNQLIVRLPSGMPFVVPPNLYIIGTMNTADKSISLLDIALRRRFDFKALYPNYDLPQLAAIDALKKINEQIIQLKGRDFQIGHAYFFKDTYGNFDINYALNKQIIPLLYEYFRHDEQAIQAILANTGFVVTTGESGILKISN